MAIKNKLIHFKTLDNFNKQLKLNNIPENSIVFIQDAKYIWTHGNLYHCEVTKKDIDSKSEVISNALVNLENNKINISEKGKSNGVAELDSLGKIKEVQLPKSVVDLMNIMYDKLTDINMKTSKDNNIIEKGINNSITISWDYLFNKIKSKPDTMKLLSEGKVLTNSNTIYSFTDTINKEKVYTVETTKNNIKSSESLIINAYYPKYFGESNKTYITESDILGLNKQPISDNSFGHYIINLNKDNYLWLCFPESISKLNIITSNGFIMPLEKPIIIKTSTKSNYICYRSSNIIKKGIINLDIY